MIVFHLEMIFSLKYELKTPVYETKADAKRQSPANLTLKLLSFTTSSPHLLLFPASKPINFSAIESFAFKSPSSFNFESRRDFCSSNFSCNCFA